MKVVINDCHGGFGISKNAEDEYVRIGGTLPEYDEFERTDPLLIQIVENMGDAANGDFASLQIVEIPDDVEWCIEGYDGLEWVAEKHRTWG